MGETMATTKEIWTERLARWRASGVGLEEFATREGVKPASMKWWRWRLGGAPQPTKPVAPKPRSKKQRFVEVAVETSRPPRRRRAKPTSAQPVPTTFDIVLENGRVVRVPAGFSADELARVLDVAEQPR